MYISQAYFFCSLTKFIGGFILCYVIAFVMAGGKGTRLKALTRDRCKPACDIFGLYRIFDFVATNIACSGIPAMLISTQFEPRSLNRHIGNGAAWGFNGINKRVEILDPYQERKGFITFEGTADSVRKNLSLIEIYNPDIALVLGGDHVYAMDYTDVIEQHKINDADITIMTSVVSENRASDFGIIKIDESLEPIMYYSKNDRDSNKYFPGYFF